MDERMDITDIIDNPEILAGCRLVEYVDPTDAAYRLIEVRAPAMPIYRQSDRTELEGKAAMVGAFRHFLGGVLWPLAAYDQDLADDVVAAFKHMGVLPENFSFTVTVTEPPPS